MKFPSLPKSFGRTLCAVLMAALLTNIPHVVLAEMAKTTPTGMISTAAVVDELTRAQALVNVEGFLQQSEVRQRLMERGLSSEEVKLRVASLSETELKQLSKQMDQARAGGDILVAILLVVLIIFLIKRI